MSKRNRRRRGLNRSDQKILTFDPQSVATMTKEQLELQLTITDLTLKSREIELKERELGKLPYQLYIALGTIAAASIAGVAGFLISLVGGQIQASASRELEQRKFEASSKLAQQKFEADLILGSIKTGDVKIAKTNLQFLLEAGLLKDEYGNLAKMLVEKPSPVLPSARTNNNSLSDALLSKLDDGLTSDNVEPVHNLAEEMTNMILEQRTYTK